MTASETQVGGSHYKDAAVQPWDVVDTWPREQQIGYHRGNALKYVMRLGSKDASVQEAKKAIHYLQKLVEVLESEQPAPEYAPLVDQEAWDAAVRAAAVKPVASYVVEPAEITAEWEGVRYKEVAEGACDECAFSSKSQCHRPSSVMRNVFGGTCGTRNVIYVRAD